MKKNEALAYRRKIELAAESQGDEQALESIELFPAWQVGMQVVAKKRYRYNAKLYRCNQAHTTQPDWTPDITPALWTEVSVEEWPEWKQPTGAQDAYNAGDKVTYKGEHYISLIDNNTWSPEAYPAGWKKC